MLTPNMLVDPTNILLAPFALWFFYRYIKFYVKSTPSNYKSSLWLSLLLIFATLVKPAFTNIILVMIGIYYLFHLRRFASSKFLHDLVIYLPSCLVLIWQLVLITNSDAGGGIEFAPYKVIRLFTSHPFIALFQAIAFPLLVTFLCVLNAKNAPRQHLNFAWMFCFAHALLIFS